MPGDSVVLAVTTLVWFLFFPREAAGACRHPAFPTPSCFRGWIFSAQSGRELRRGMRGRVSEGGYLELVGFVVPATRLRQGFAGARSVGRRSFSEGGKRGPIRRVACVERRCSTAFVQQRRPVVMGPGSAFAPLTWPGRRREEMRGRVFRHGRACPGHPRLSVPMQRRGCPAQGRA